jgi:protein phosphatase
MVGDDVIAETLAIESLDEAADRLVELALAGGGVDNVTVVIGELVEAAGDPGEPQLVGAAADRPRRRPLVPEPTATIAPPPDVEELRYSYVPPHRMGWLRYGLVVGVALLVLFAGSVALYRASQSQYFVGVSNDHVAVYRGVEADLPFISLNSVVYETDIPIATLTRVNRDLVVEGIEAGDRAEADATVARLRATQPKPKPKPKPSPTATPSASPTTVDTAPSTA